jgi:hypothetical protein
MWRDRDLTVEEGRAQLERDLCLAKRLGFTSIRPKFGVVTPELDPHPIWQPAVERILDLAADLDLVICPEIHSPTPIKHPVTRAYLDFIDRIGSDRFKLLIDTGIFQTAPVDDGHEGFEGKKRPPSRGVRRRGSRGLRCVLLARGRHVVAGPARGDHDPDRVAQSVRPQETRIRAQAPSRAAQQDVTASAGAVDAPAEGREVTGQRKVGGAAGLGPQSDGGGSDPPYGGLQGRDRDRTAQHQNAPAMLRQHRGERLQREGVLLARQTRQENRRRACGPAPGDRACVSVAEGRGDVPGEQVFHFHVPVVGGLPCAPDRSHGRGEHLLPCGDQAVRLDGRSDLLVHGFGVHPDRRLGECPAPSA